jgi:hypothetical protein
MEELMTGQATDTSTAERLTQLEQAVASLQEQIEGYRRVFNAAAASPFARQLLAQLGIKIPKGGL